ncbi:FMRFamide-related neuropeptides-like [Dreissena polymorpha]|uniref:Uncharacterized protein n=1 Tax=Dreissena polymorpha TaxID=45954 RepID=A0A9D4RXE2_DREPO|nr:FMRFamide-related neuropeptides-like [Dreissena polymorpha]KAH3882418.1 hypothetical protein DPMN_006356 [Dreissena polymorpha]
MRISALIQALLIFTASYICLSQPAILTDGEDVDDYDDLDRGVDLDKRISKFVRIGKALNSFVRIGRDNPQSDLFNYYSRNGAYNDIYPIINPDDFRDNQKRMSSFVRIGKSKIPEFEDEDSYGADIEKRAGAFIRMGKFPSSAFIERLEDRMNSFGHQPYYTRTGRIGHSSFIRIGKRDTSDALRKAHTEQDVEKANEGPHRLGDGVEGKDIIPRYLRIGKDLDDVDGDMQTQKRLSNFVRIGRDYGGRNSNTGIFNSKRPSSFVRIGRQPEEFDKRYSSFVRIGRNFPFIQSDDGANQFENVDNLFKRASSFVRIGRNNLLENPEKRYSSFVRIGKSDRVEDQEKRASSFVRIGKSGQVALDDDTTNDLVKRASSFVRIGRDVDDGTDSEEQAQPSKRASSFVRIGKSTVDTKGINSESDRAFKM